MFLCDLLNNIAGTAQSTGITDIPVIGTLLMYLLESLWSLLGCGD